ncbi:MAG: glycerate kinase [Methylococcaceae bacterium]|nr:glycerate kinase [Methylococcaceae bacterium]
MNPLEHPDIASARKNALHIFKAGVDAADPYRAVRQCLSIDNGQIEIRLNPDNYQSKRIGNWSKIHLLAFGKAACAMTKAVQDAIPETLFTDRGLVVTNYENVIPLGANEVIGASHPLPDAAGLAAAKKMAARVRNVHANELILVLISGGGSALIPFPVDTITLQEKIATTNLLLVSGATINQINCVRKHLSQLKGGGLARLAAPADLHAFILSDVLGDDLSAIASGPTVPDDTSFADAVEVIKSRGIWASIPAAVRHHLEQGRLGLLPETPKSGDQVFATTSHTLVGSNAISVTAMLEASAALGYQSQLYSAKLCGIAREEAEKWVVHAKQLLANGISKPVALLAGGETTVNVTGHGQGGRNQEMALAFAMAAERHGLTANWTFLSGGTDGRDGPTDATGGLVDPDTLKRLANSTIMPQQMLANNDAYNALKHSQDLIMTGATGTNVADLQVLLIQPTLSK